jgi:hypothetical protein
MRELFVAVTSRQRQPAQVMERLIVRTCAQRGIDVDTIADPDELLAMSSFAELGAARGLQVMRVLRER